MPGMNYTDFELELINDLKLLKGKLGHTPSAQEVDKERGMQKSEVYKRHFGSWLRVQELVKGCSASYDDSDEEEDPAAEYVKKIEKEVPTPKNVPGVAPGLDKALDEIEAENSQHGGEVKPFEFWRPNLRLPEKKPAVPASSEKTPEQKTSTSKQPEKATEKVLEKKSNLELAKKPAPEKKEESKTAPEKKEEPKAIPEKKEELKVIPGKNKNAPEKKPEPVVEKQLALEKKSEPAAEKKPNPEKKSEFNLINFLGKDAYLSHLDEPVKRVPCDAKLEVRFCNWHNCPSSARFNQMTCERELGGIQVQERIIQIIDPRDREKFYPYDTLPDWKRDTYYMVYREMAEEIRKTGRTTEDLLLPTIFCEDELENAIYIHQLEVLSS